MNGHDPYAYLKDVLMPLPTQRAREIGPLLPVATGSNGSFSAGHVHESCWSNPMQMTGQVECKWVGKSVQLPTRKAKSSS
jgi:hypothetical protein